MRINEQAVSAVEINFLCVHKNLRSKRVAPMLIKEITRRVNLFDIWFATYTAGIVVPRPVSEAQYFHRSINPKKLIDIGFSGKPRDKSILQVKKEFQLPENISNEFIPLTIDHVTSGAKLINSYHEKAGTQLYVHFTEEEFKHFFLPRDQIIQAYVIVDDQNNVTDFISFYHLPSTVFGKPDYDTLNVAYSFYNVTSTVTLTAAVGDALILAKNDFGSDVFNMLALGKNPETFKDLKFTPGDGVLNYYVYNWKCEQFPSDKLGLVLF